MLSRILLAGVLLALVGAAPPVSSVPEAATAPTSPVAEQGETVSGKLALETGPLLPQACLLRIVPTPYDRKRPKLYAGDPLLVQRKLSGDGSFSIAPVTAGVRALEVTCPGFLPLHVDDVRVRPGRETKIRKTLLLRRPISVEVAITPPLAPEGQPWRVHLDRISLGPCCQERPAGRNRGNADLEGRFSVPRIAPALARLEIFTSSGVRRYVRDFLFDPAPAAPIRVDLRPVDVRIRVTRGGQPINAQVELIDSASGKSVRRRISRSGKSRAILPRGGRWRVAVELSDWNLPRITFDRDIVPDPNGEALLSIELPEGYLRGRVLDPYGRPAPWAEVSLAGLEERRTARADREGRFFFGYLRPGFWSVAARRPEGSDGPAAAGPPAPPAGTLPRLPRRRRSVRTDRSGRLRVGPGGLPRGAAGGWRGAAPEAGPVSGATMRKGSP